MSDVLERIATWETAGLIDRPTADRLRAAEAATATAGPSQRRADSIVHRRSGASAMFGPGISIAEIFGYLGGAFLLAAWSAFIARTSGESSDPEIAIGLMALLAAAVLAGLGLRLRLIDERGSRAAGVAFLLSATYAGGAAAAFVTGLGADWPVSGVIGSAAGLAVAGVLHVIHPSVLTQVGVLAWLTGLAASILSWLQVSFFPSDVFEATGLPTATGPDPIILVVASAAWWLATAVLIGLIGLREARSGGKAADPAAGRRAAISRFWAGMTAVIGLALAVTQSAALGVYEYGRVLEPWVGDLALLVLSAILIERAFRRDATSFMYAAALGLIVALTDFNVSYLSNSAEVALLIEGLILLAVGVGADRLRRRIGHEDDEPPVQELIAKGDPIPGGAAAGGWRLSVETPDDQPSDGSAAAGDDGGDEP